MKIHVSQCTQTEKNTTTNSAMFYRAQIFDQYQNKDVFFITLKFCKIGGTR